MKNVTLIIAIVAMVMMSACLTKSSDQFENPLYQSTDVDFQKITLSASYGSQGPKYARSRSLTISNTKGLTYTYSTVGSSCDCSKTLTDSEMNTLMAKVKDADIENFSYPPGEVAVVSGGEVKKISVTNSEGEKKSVDLDNATEEIEALAEYAEGLSCHCSPIFQKITLSTSDRSRGPEHAWSKSLDISDTKKLTFAYKTGTESCDCDKTLTDFEMDNLITRVKAADIENFSYPPGEVAVVSGGGVKEISVTNSEGEKKSVDLYNATEEIEALTEYVENLSCTCSIAREQ